jgi:hypothetical protein
MSIMPELRKIQTPLTCGACAVTCQGGPYEWPAMSGMLGDTPADFLVDVPDWPQKVGST